jgi:predicted class III extradiol MEMO1 family dioxygenase
MEQKLIPISIICAQHDVEISFADDLCDCGLIEIIEEKDEKHIAEEALERLEKMIRLHRDLEINMAGLETISHMLQEMDKLQQELVITRRRLYFYEQE